jgi:hypothetical protein
MRLFFIVRRVLLLSHLGLDLDNFLLAIGTGEQLVHPEKGLLEGQFIVPILEVFVMLQLIDEMFPNECRNLRTYLKNNLPPWPSNTAKSYVFLSESWAQICASSMYNLHPK